MLCKWDNNIAGMVVSATKNDNYIPILAGFLGNLTISELREVPN